MNPPAKQDPKTTFTFRPQKRLGQNFLINPQIQDKIIAACDLEEKDTILEIGPGMGALTGKMLPRVKKLIAVEKDAYLADQLKETFPEENLIVHHADFLKFPLKNLPKKTKVIGNLPYNAATPIIERLLLHRDLFQSIYVTVQLEHGQRLIAQPNSKDYGSLSCFVQFYCQPEILFKIKNSAFKPIPKVQSCFMRLKPFSKSRYSVKKEDLLFKIIRCGFSQRRKTIKNSLCGIIPKQKFKALIEELKLKENLRAENLKLEDFVAIANKLAK